MGEKGQKQTSAREFSQHKKPRLGGQGLCAREDEPSLAEDAPPPVVRLIGGSFWPDITSSLPLTAIHRAVE
jgi:hypothetical protein